MTEIRRDLAVAAAVVACLVAAAVVVACFVARRRETFAAMDRELSQTLDKYLIDRNAQAFSTLPLHRAFESNLRDLADMVRGKFVYGVYPDTFNRYYFWRFINTHRALMRDGKLSFNMLHWSADAGVPPKDRYTDDERQALLTEHGKLYTDILDSVLEEVGTEDEVYQMSCADMRKNYDTLKPAFRWAVDLPAANCQGWVWPATEPEPEPEPEKEPPRRWREILQVLRQGLPRQ